MIDSNSMGTEMKPLRKVNSKELALNSRGSESVCAFCLSIIKDIGHAECVERYSLCSDLAERGFLNLPKRPKRKILPF